MSFWKGTMFVQLLWLCCRVSPIFLHSVPDICAQPLWSQWTASLIFLHNLINVITVSYIFAQTHQSSCTASSIFLSSCINHLQNLIIVSSISLHSLISMLAQYRFQTCLSYTVGNMTKRYLCLPQVQKKPSSSSDTWLGIFHEYVPLIYLKKFDLVLCGWWG